MEKSKNYTENTKEFSRKGKAIYFDLIRDTTINKVTW